ncbi:uncharacterized protein [Periplaneta americana]|uniref:uncharacterized protein n=1 Tax=Periplaneta americana TaxID=6978 RepID=UPI0037E82B2E
MSLEDKFLEMGFERVAMTSDPETLSALALSSLSKYVAALLVEAAIEAESTELRNIKKTSEHLQNMIKNTVPPFLANEVTEHLIKGVGSMFRVYYDSPYRTKFEKIAPIILSAIVHPAVTRLELYKDEDHFAISDRYFYYVPTAIIYSLHNASALQVLRFSSVSSLHRNFFDHKLRVSKDLQEFSSNICTDKMLTQLCRVCKTLKVLNLSYSSITDDSVLSICLLRNLEEIDISGTDITKDGVFRILQGFVEVENHELFKYMGCCSVSAESVKPSLLLKSFGCGRCHYACNPWESTCLNLLFQYFPSLTSLSLHCMKSPTVDQIKRLNFLTKLTLQLMTWQDYYEHMLVVQSCPNLVYLNIGKIHPVDLRLFIKDLPSLRCLHVDISPRDYDGENDTEVCESMSLPENKSVTCLRLAGFRSSTMMEYVITKFRNVKSLYVTDRYRCVSGALFQKLFQRIILQNLEEFVINEYNSKFTEVLFNDESKPQTTVRYTHFWGRDVLNRTRKVSVQ